ncbi:MAG: tetratricopeptide repeat protein [Phormidium tanganyikae FI6-MK23]|nr:tetratricopeptide repeat protein [Phormidium tanganyikae FI6-MK23]
MTDISCDKKGVSQGWLGRAIALSQNGWYEAAIACRGHAETTDPDTWHYRGYVLGKLGRYKAAIACYEKTFELDCTDAKAWYNYGQALTKLKRYDEEIGQYDRD